MFRRSLFTILLVGVEFISIDAQQTMTPIQEVSFTQVHLEDDYWLPRIEVNRKVSIPSAFRE